MGDKTDTTTPYPCLLSPEEQAKLRFMKVKNNNFKSNELVASAPTPVTVTGVMQQIFDLVLGSDQATVTISSIPQTFISLMLMVSGRSTAALTNDTLQVQFNGDGGNNYSNTIIFANSGTVSSSVTNGFSFGRLITLAGANASTSTRIGSNVGYIHNYRNTSFDKNMVANGGDYGGTNPLIGTVYSTWQSTAAITSILVAAASGSLKTGSRITLYGF